MRTVRTLGALAASSALLAVPAGIGSAARGATVTRLDVTVAPGLRLETIASRLRTPRSVLPLDDEVYLLEFGGWGKKLGAISRLRRQGSTWRRTTILRQLDRPVGLALGPDGKVYFGEVGRISRFDPKAAAPTAEPVIKGLPGLGRHPLASFVFTEENDILVNVGSKTDNCENQKGRATCAEAEGTGGFGLLRRYTMVWPAGTASGFTVEARGLRNSMGLAVHESGTILQAENSRDFIDDADPKLSDEELPHDELNVIEAGKAYGWPYCYDNRRNSPEFKAYDCTRTTAPTVLLPAHSAPLGMAYWGDRLVVGYHGYRDTGHRLVSFPVDDQGVPQLPSTELIGDWEEDGDQLAGGPVGMAVAPDDSLWLTDDRNNLLLRLRRA